MSLKCAWLVGKSGHEGRQIEVARTMSRTTNNIQKITSGREETIKQTEDY